ncbi:MAG: oxidoreductase [Bacteroidetes bacterium]|nr:oxidoreductase [Bacteroidota bacterium]
MQATTITLIGAGNVATQLGIALREQGYAISQVYSPTKKSAEALAKKVNAAAITDLKKLHSNSIIYIIAVKDDAIETVAKQLHFKNQIVVHTSGTVPIDVLKKTSKNYGVLYPLQTFSKEKAVDLKTTPVCIEANNKPTSTTLQYFAKSFSGNVQQVSSGQRKTIHLAAVFACNFSNHMYAVAEGILKKDKLSLDLLQPLIEETAAKIKNNSPVKMQTGPAARGDKKTMKAHLKLIADADNKKIYQLISKGIIQTLKNDHKQS